MLIQHLVRLLLLTISCLDRTRTPIAQRWWREISKITCRLRSYSQTASLFFDENLSPRLLREPRYLPIRTHQCDATHLQAKRQMSPAVGVQRCE